MRDEVLEVVRRIPRGRVATYGDVAHLAGSPRAARQVGWVLSDLRGEDDVPWWRVVNAKGGISWRPGGCVERQRELLEQEGVAFREDGTLDLGRWRWDDVSV